MKLLPEYRDILLELSVTPVRQDEQVAVFMAKGLEEDDAEAVTRILCQLPTTGIHELLNSRLMSKYPYPLVEVVMRLTGERRSDIEDELYIRGHGIYAPVPEVCMPLWRRMLPREDTVIDISIGLVFGSALTALYMWLT